MEYLTDMVLTDGANHLSKEANCYWLWISYLVCRRSLKSENLRFCRMDSNQNKLGEGCRVKAYSM